MNTREQFDVGYKLVNYQIDKKKKKGKNKRD